jgi:AraC family transcriptional regulator
MTDCDISAIKSPVGEVTERDLVGLIKEFMGECEARLPAANRILSATGIRITHSLIRGAYGISGTQTHIGSRVEIHRTIEYLQTHASEKISVAKPADMAAMSPSRFSRIFKRETG